MTSGAILFLSSLDFCLFVTLGRFCSPTGWMDWMVDSVPTSILFWVTNCLSLINQYQRTHSINALYQRTLSTHFINALYQRTLSTHFINALYQRTVSLALLIVNNVIVLNTDVGQLIERHTRVINVFNCQCFYLKQIIKVSVYNTSLIITVITQSVVIWWWW